MISRKKRPYPLALLVCTIHASFWNVTGDVVDGAVNDCNVIHRYIGNAWLSALCYDAKQNRAFVGSYSQQIYICDVSVNPPQVLHTLKGHTGN
jgi:hypothetical protein